MQGYSTLEIIIIWIVNFAVFIALPFIVIRYFYRIITKPKKEVDNTGNTIDKTIKSTITFASTNINKAKKFTEKSISKSYITNCTWILTNNDDLSVFYTFLNNNELLITKNGEVEKAKYELIIDNNSILITRNNKTEYFNIVNIENDFLFLNKLSTDVILIFANQTKFKDLIKADLKKIAKNKYDYEKDNYRL